ncbi:hypothetical protein IGI04_014992 [Brassica rapa subsp. trilocularis]|uniref:Uncharacterized protein n=2 Tax=Brassica campestris TaxID=3711 RepID=A0A3P6CMH9_BRACM|nr:hypothetical protein IGI04_014992 [Brassica rapa subsp. trilocularis]CAG7906071.1 unnamed protein product [Brassica rapa]VDD11635.1 unnamed protein product [Brassica rapa]
MTGKYSTQTGDTIISLDADLATMMGMMQNLMERFERQDTSNKAINERVDDQAAAYTQPCADEQDPDTARRQLFKTNVNPTVHRVETNQVDQATTQKINVLLK